MDDVIAVVGVPSALGGLEAAARLAEAALGSP
jgi:hypothetical protein